jgi:hypothetical protein
MKKPVKKPVPVEPDWAAIRPRYEDTTEPLVELAAAYGLTWQKISNHAGRKGWKLRKPKTEQRKAADLRGAALMPTKLAGRLKRLIAREIDAIENESTDGRSATDRERDARRLASLVRSLDKLHDIKAAKDKRNGTATHDDLPGENDLRGELQRRFARLVAGAATESVSGKSEPRGDSLAD